MKLNDEKITRLQEVAGVTEAQAREALNASDGDLLEGLLWLEKMGIISSSGVGSYSTAGNPQAEPAAEPLTADATPEEKGRSIGGKIKWVWRWLVNNRLEAYKKYDPSRQIQCPIGALIGLVCIAWYVVVGILIVGICLGWRYRLAGPQLGKKQINSVVDWIDDLAEKARDEVRDQVERRGNARR